MSHFRDLWSDASQIVEDVLGDCVDLVPQVSGKFLRCGADPNNPARELTGIFEADSAIDVVKGSGANTHENADTVSQLATIEFDEEDFIDQTLPQAGWFVVLKTFPRQPSYEIVTAEPDTFGKIICKLSFKAYTG